LANGFFVQQRLGQMVQLVTLAGQQTTGGFMTLFQQALDVLVDASCCVFAVIPSLSQLVSQKGMFLVGLKRC
jgi:hypothetical protein